MKPPPGNSASGPYLPGRRGWIKTKNRDYWRYPMEVRAAMEGR